MVFHKPCPAPERTCVGMLLVTVSGESHATSEGQCAISLADHSGESQVGQQRLGTKQAEMKIVGCDLHAKRQTIAMVDTETGEFTEWKLLHEGNQVGEFYAALEGPVVVGIEATGRCSGFWISWKSWGSSAGSDIQ